MFRAFITLATVTLSDMLTVGLAPLFAQTAKDDMKGAKNDVKEAGRSTGRAAKKTGRATKKTTKKAVNKSAEKTEEGADAVRRKTKPYDRAILSSRTEDWMSPCISGRRMGG